MAIHDVRLFSLAPARPAFAEPDWRGGDCVDERSRLRPMSEIAMQVGQLASWISAGEDYGWLGLYQARRAAFELQSIRLQIAEGRTNHDGSLADRDRLAVQARLDRLGACLDAAREVFGAG
jgi:hypothetical protein